jgi:hypothetical protein
MRAVAPRHVRRIRKAAHVSNLGDTQLTSFNETPGLAESRFVEDLGEAGV